mmetsp:Transcript_8989/g.17921  ORF Transcript_8989/g.17921 Transcript_8989/m.17921 type:complete len:1419 (-) Transcript_8989:154-4410(-)
MVSSVTEETKEFIIQSNDEAGFVEVTSTSTLSEVRQLIIEEFDTEQLPSQSEEFAFKVNGVRQSQKQEARKNAFELLELQATVEIIPRVNNDRKRKIVGADLPVGANETNDSISGSSKKKLKVDSCAVTPFQSSSSSIGDSKGAAAKDKRDSGKGTTTGSGDTSTAGTMDTATVSSIDPTDLDKKKFSTSNDDEEKKKSGSDANEMDVDNGKDNDKTLSDSQDFDKEFITEETSGNDDDRDDDDIDAGAQAKNREDDDSDDDNELLNDVEKDGRKKSPGILNYFAKTVAEGVSSVMKSTMTSSKDNEDEATEDGAEKQTTDADSSDDELMQDIEKDASAEMGDEAASDALAAELNPHKEADEAKEKSRQVLKELTDMLNNNKNFCSEARKDDWLEEINQLTKKSSPQTVFGVLGNTGVGKSSLLNGLLDEAAVLPTSGSRGCTAAVVELVYNSELLKEPDTTVAEKLPVVPAYKGTVEFITLDDWTKELKVLVEECSTQEKHIYSIPPIDDTSEAYAAWQKIEQVYGKGAMGAYCRQPTESVLHRLASNPRVQSLLSSSDPTREYNAILVDAGDVVPGSDEAKELLKPFNQMKGRTRNKKKKWATTFRQKINSYVYRKGNGDEPQTWPLIRKVTLEGPWHVLSTGAVLVDLPGVRDANAARAKVAEKYLQNCNQIAIVAPIKRAVDDGTAKELLGEQFKRRLLMDGQYSNVFFICTQTDDLEPTETMRDHSDVAQEEPGRWEKMTELASEITSLEKQISDKLQEEEDLEGQVEEFKQQYQEAVADLTELREEAEDDEIDEDQLVNLKAVIATAKSSFKQSTRDLAKWREDNTARIQHDQEKCDALQKQLKPLCAIVRNEYSKQCLQEDFRSGLKDLYKKDDGDDDDGGGVDVNAALPEDFNMDVFGISANDYLKLMKIKPSRDGPPSCFSNAEDTQIPLLRAFVHTTTAKHCQDSVKTFVEQTNDLVEQMKLLCTDSNSDVSTGSARRMKQLHKSSVHSLTNQIKPIATQFKQVIDQKVSNSLASSLKTGARKGSQSAISTVVSWGSKSRRSKSERAPDKNGLYYSTYNAVARRDGVYTSKSAGAVDFNQELCDPMEKEFSTEWQSVLDSTIRRLLAESERKILDLSTSACQSFAQSLRSNGVAADRLGNMLNTANRSATTALKTSFTQMRSIARDAQRELSRELLPAVQEKMKSSYTAVKSAQGGPGVFERMKGAMVSNSQRAVNDMFDSAMDKLMKGIKALINRLERLLESTATIVGKSLENVFSICWDDNSDKTTLIDPQMQKLIQDCRNALLPELNRLQTIQGDACELLGIEREEVELDLVGVESLEQQLSRRVAEAEKNGNMLDLCDSDADVPAPKKMAVKSEKGAVIRKKSPLKTSAAGVIDLCDSDSDEDEEGNIFGKCPSTVNVKTEAWL